MTQTDVLLRGAQVVDGTGEPARAADVEILDGRIARVGRVSRSDAPKMDLAGLVLAPGFIDIHTHYDAQVLWDRDLTPSSWHGVSTVIMGNCGFGIAPAAPEARMDLILTLENVEGMSRTALEQGIDWRFESFPEYLDALEAEPVRLNIGAYLGHSPLRYYVLGKEATEREATDDEIARMRQLVVEAMQSGAVGLSTSRSASHGGAMGKPVPSRLASWEELRRIAEPLRDLQAGVMQAAPGLSTEEIELIYGFAQGLGRPLTWTAFLSGIRPPEESQRILDLTSSVAADVWPQIACRAIVMQITMADPGPLARIEPFREVLARPQDGRALLYRDPDWRERARVATGADRLWGPRLSRLLIEETNDLAADGCLLGDIAAARGGHPFDVMLDIAVADGLRTRFTVAIANDDEEELTGFLRDKRTLLGLSDAGAHASQLCDAVFATHLLGYWVRERGVLTLEEAVWRLTGHPASVFGLTGRGRIAEGHIADLVAFDPNEIGAEPNERVRDLPGGADRLIARSKGVEHVWVGGTFIRHNGKDLDGVRPGKLLRGTS